MVFAAENQGVWVALIDPTDDDPVVWYDGGPERLREREQLSGFVFQFALNEAASTSPFTGFATVTTEVLDWFVEDLVPVPPLQPMRVPGNPTPLGGSRLGRRGRRLWREWHLAERRQPAAGSRQPTLSPAAPTLSPRMGAV
ncbi:hypothetical protein ABZ780_29210 [Micromonospora sp. NPDC047467]|uniref:hypothetical protein n=1 Tax=Micromonospora sp. NPDC047467 TaxID=3154814 RepID=UPI0033C5A172